MGDGGCAVLVSQHPLDKFHCVCSYHSDQAWDWLSLVPECVTRRSYWSNLKLKSPFLLDYDKDLSWHSIRAYDMEPCRSSQDREAAEQRKEDGIEVGKSNNAVCVKVRQHTSRWDIVDNALPLPARQEREHDEGNTGTRRVDKEADEGGQVSRKEISSRAQLQPKGEELGQNSHMHVQNCQVVRWETPASCIEANDHVSSGRGAVQGKEGRVADGEHNSGISYYVSDRDTKENSASKWNDQDPLPSCFHGRGSLRAKEYRSSWSNSVGSLDGNWEKGAWHYSGRNTCSSRYHARDKFHDDTSGSGHFESSTYRSCSDGHEGRNNYERGNDRNDHGRNRDMISHARDRTDRCWSRCNVAAKRSNLRDSSEHCIERSYPGRHEDVEHGRESRMEEYGAQMGNAKDARHCQNWGGRDLALPQGSPDRFCRDDIKPSQELATAGNIPKQFQECGKCQSLPDTLFEDDASELMGVQISTYMSSPISADDMVERLCEMPSNRANCWSGNEGARLELAETHQQPEQRGWVFLDSDGNTQGPVELAVLKKRLENGLLQSDHLVKLHGTNEWITLEHAPMTGDTTCMPLISLEQRKLLSSLPTVATNFPSRANGSACDQQTVNTGIQPGNMEDLQIDERVEHLMQGFVLVAGKEKEVISEALSLAVRCLQQENEIDLENEDSPRSHTDLAAHWKEDQLVGDNHILGGVAMVSQALNEPAFGIVDTNEPVVDTLCTNSFQSTRKWTSRGGDWRLVGEPESTHMLKNKANAGFDRISKMKVVLNGGIPLCEIRQSGLPDPRKDLEEFSKVEAFTRRKLEVPSWASRLQEEKSEDVQRAEMNFEDQLQSCQTAIATTLKAQVLTSKSQVSATATMDAFQKAKSSKAMAVSRWMTERMEHPSMALPVHSVPALLKCDSIDISRNITHAHVSPGNFSNEPSEKTNSHKGFPLEVSTPEKDSSGLPQSSCSGNFLKSEISMHSMNDRGLQSEKSVEQLMKIQDLRLYEGEWYFKDGSGHEIGPFSYTQLQLMVEEGSVLNGISVYRKSDEVWVPLHCHPTSCQAMPSAMMDGYLLAFSGRENSTVSARDSICPVVEGGAPVSVYQSGLLPCNASRNPCTLVPSFQASAISLCAESASVFDGSHTEILKPDRDQSSIQEPNIGNFEGSLCFHQLYPQFIGYMHGKLHEHVMKSYRVRDFAATLHEGLDKWLNKQQYRNILEGAAVSCLPPSVSAAVELAGAHSVTLQKESQDLDHLSSAVVSSTGFSSSRSEQSLHSKIQAVEPNQLGFSRVRRMAKRKRPLDTQDSQLVGIQPLETHTSDLKTSQKQDISSLESGAETGFEVRESFVELETGHNWMTVDSRVLVKVFSFLEDDLKALVFASATCKFWRSTFECTMKELRQIDLSSLGGLCTDGVFESFMGYVGQQLHKLVMRSCTSISESSLKSALFDYPFISLVDISGCDQLKELVREFPVIKWVCHHSNDLPQKGKSLKPLGDKKFYAKKDLENMQQGHSLDDSVGKKRSICSEVLHDEGAAEPMDLDYPHYIDRDLETNYITQMHPFSKYMVVNNADKLKDNSVNYRKVVQQDCAAVGLTSREKGDMLTQKRKCKREPVTTLGNRDKSIEKYMLQVLKAVKAADTQKLFFHQGANNKAILASTGCALKFSAIEGKLRAGEYPGSRDGLMSFKNDLFLLCRSAFHFGQKGSAIFKAGEKIFKLAHRLVKHLEDNFSETDNLKHVETNGVLSKLHSGNSDHHQFGSNVAGSKRNILKSMGRERAIQRRGMDDSSADEDTDGDFSGKEGKRFSSSKKKQLIDLQSDISSSDEEDENLFEEQEDTDESEPDMETESEGEDLVPSENVDSSDGEILYPDFFSRQWGARMTKASMVPPVTRKYEVIEEYVIVIDGEEVNKRMKVALPENYEAKLQAARVKRGSEYSHLEIPDLKEYKPRKQLGVEVLEQEVYGIDPYTHNLLLDTMPKDRVDFSEARRQKFIEEELLWALNKEARKFTGGGKAPMKYSLEPVVQRLVDEAKDLSARNFCQAFLRNMQSRLKDKYVAYRKGLGVVCNKEDGLVKDDFVVEFFGEAYPAWRWFEKQDAIRSYQRKQKDPAPEFYNIFLERPKGDALGYDLVVVDAMHKANYASRICHSCRPNCEAKVTAVDGRYQIGVYTLRSVQYGEELTFDYNSVTESEEEYEASVCLCGSRGCRGSYLNLAGPETFQEVMKEFHGLLDRHQLLLDACAAGCPTDADYYDLKQAGIGSCLLDGLPYWVIGFAVSVVRFLNMERTQLPAEIIKTIVKERRLDSYGEVEMADAEVQADGVYNQRLQNLAITLDKVKYVFKQLYSDPTVAPPPLRKLDPAEVVSLIWKGENSVVAELLRCMENHLTEDDFVEFKQKVHEHDPPVSANVEKNLFVSLLWLRDELRKTPVTCLSRHDAAADVIHMYAYTEFFFTSQDYESFESPPLTINHLDLGLTFIHTVGTTCHEWKKMYNKDYVLGQLMFWYKQNSGDPGSSLAKARRGCLVLPDVSSCYAKSLHQDPRIEYGSRLRTELFRRMERRPQKQWPKKELWEFKGNRVLLGSPMMDAVRKRTVVNEEMMGWLRRQPVDFQGPWDDQRVANSEHFVLR